MRISLIIFLLLLAGCTLEPQKIEQPKGLIPEDSMITVMYQMGLLESHLQQKYVQLEQYAKVLRLSGDSLLINQGVSRERYALSMDYYSKNPALFSAIYDTIIKQYELGSVPTTDSLGLDQFSK